MSIKRFDFHMTPVPGVYQTELGKFVFHADVEALERDAARLDWLQANPRLSEMRIEGKIVNCYAYAIAGHSKWTLRELIDAAIASERSKP